MMQYVCAGCCFLIPPCAGQRGSVGGDIRLSRTREIPVRDESAQEWAVPSSGPCRRATGASHRQSDRAIPRETGFKAQAAWLSGR